ncbi:TrkH family potassium uptake protein [Nitriliruptor alkaliphilus]|uniref:TrkH family potassium uptake protein n=1 Tax=Nitriliruptor alkaliphilus TaxID=427918 RepID=UPI0006961278|nr:potassium transporter TrkG [Nitriliruptor alkaliphilus]
MLLRPGADDLRLIGFYLGKVLLGLSLVMLLPAVYAAILGEWNSLTAFVIGASICVSFGAFTEAKLATRRSLTWAHGMVTVALAWLVGAVLAAVPLHLSGHYDDLLSALFEGMSGLTTTGLSVINDLDHTHLSMDFYRHLLHFAGGQGIIIVVLSLFAAGGGRIGTLYVSEARDERILPNFIRTSRFIFRVAATYGVIGTTALYLALLGAGFTSTRALYHAVNLFLGAFDTGGFSPMQASITYYHSASVEIVIMILMLAGAISFGLHFHLWSGEPRQVWRHLETRTLAISTSLLFTVVCFGLLRTGTYDGAVPLLRKGLFTLMAAVSSAGYQVNAGTTYLSDWGVLAPAAIVAAMAIGGMASSTAGGVKAMRVGITAKTLIHDVKKLLQPESALVVTTYHVGKRQILRDSTARAATSVLLLFVVTYLIGAVVGLSYGGYDITQTLFESVSATSNIGLSIGVTDPGMPRGLMATYIVQMWLGRLEFVAVFAFLGYLFSLGRGRAST